ncbi:unnamed protein product, partial [marine sediment metagenome]
MVITAKSGGIKSVRVFISPKPLIPISTTNILCDLFFAIIGPSFDGHDFIIEAFNKGAMGAVACKSMSSLLQNEEIDKNKVIVE